MTSNVGRDLRTSEKKVRKFLHSQPYGKGFGQVIRCQPVEEVCTVRPAFVPLSPRNPQPQSSTR